MFLPVGRRKDEEKRDLAPRAPVPACVQHNPKTRHVLTNPQLRSENQNERQQTHLIMPRADKILRAECDGARAVEVARELLQGRVRERRK
jgi:hypothetical protein